MPSPASPHDDGRRHVRMDRAVIGVGAGLPEDEGELVVGVERRRFEQLRLAAIDDGVRLIIMVDPHHLGAGVDGERLRLEGEIVDHDLVGQSGDLRRRMAHRGMIHRRRGHRRLGRMSAGRSEQHGARGDGKTERGEVMARQKVRHFFLGPQAPSVASWIVIAAVERTKSMRRMPSMDFKRSAGTFIGPGPGPSPAAGCGNAVEHRGLERDGAFDLLHHLMDVPVEHGDRAEALQIGQRLCRVIGSPAPLRIERPERHMREDDDRRAGAAALRSSASHSSCSAPR